MRNSTKQSFKFCFVEPPAEPRWSWASKPQKIQLLFTSINPSPSFIPRQDMYFARRCFMRTAINFHRTVPQAVVLRSVMGNQQSSLATTKPSTRCKIHHL